MKQKSAIVPYRFKDDLVEILLIRNNTNTKWIIPKGTIETSLETHISATKEAYEEAGVLGKTHPIIIGKYYRNEQWIPTYMLEVHLELADYEEQEKRVRKWIKPEEIEDHVSDINLVHLIKTGIKCVHKNGYYFQYAIQTFCYENQYKIESINKKRVKIQVRVEGIQKQVQINRRKSTLEFSIPSKVVFQKITKVPRTLSARFLVENAEKKIGFWCLQEFENQVSVTRMHKEELKLLNSIFFKQIIEELANTCDQFEKEYKK